MTEGCRHRLHGSAVATDKAADCRRDDGYDASIEPPLAGIGFRGPWPIGEERACCATQPSTVSGRPSVCVVVQPARAMPVRHGSANAECRPVATCDATSDHHHGPRLSLPRCPAALRPLETRGKIVVERDGSAAVPDGAGSCGICRTPPPTPMPRRRESIIGVSGPPQSCTRFPACWSICRWCLRGCA